MTQKNENKTGQDQAFKPIRIWSEDKMIDHEISCRKKLIGQVAVLKQELDEECIRLNQEILSKFVQEGYIAISRILLENAEKQLKKLKVGSIVLESLKSDADYTAKIKLAKLHQPLVKALYACHISSDEIEFDKTGSPVLTDEQIDKIKQKWTVHINTVQDKAVYDSLQAYCQVHNQMGDLLKEHGHVLRMGDCLIRALTENDFIAGHPGEPSELRDDIFLRRDPENEGRLIVNSKYFKR